MKAKKEDECLPVAKSFYEENGGTLTNLIWRPGQIGNFSTQETKLGIRFEEKSVSTIIF